MNKIFLVGLGGFIGSILRYVMNGSIHSLMCNANFPYGTFVVNMIGCFFIGMLSYCIELQINFSAEIRLFLMVGFLGSFTTYSTFSNETMSMLQNQKVYMALINISTHIIIGLIAVFAGRFVTAMMWK